VVLQWYNAVENMKSVFSYLMQEVAYELADQGIWVQFTSEMRFFFTGIPQQTQNYPTTYTAGTGEVSGFCHGVIESFSCLGC